MPAKPTGLLNTNRLHIAGADKICQTGTHVVAFFDVGHVGHIFEQQYLGVLCLHGLSQSHLDRDAGVILAIDEEGWHFQLT